MNRPSRQTRTSLTLDRAAAQALADGYSSLGIADSMSQSTLDQLAREAEARGCVFRLLGGAACFLDPEDDAWDDY